MAILETDFTQLMNQARVTLLGSSDAGLKGAFYDVVSEFLNDSSIWTQDVDFAVIPASHSYQVSVNEGQILRLVGVAAADNTFIPALMPELGTIVLQHAPNTNATYTATFVTNIALPTTKQAIPLAPDWLLPVWHVGLLDGLLGKMMIQPNKSYSNLQQGAYHLKRFRDAIGRARVSKLRANTIGSAAWRFPQGFRTVSQQGGVPSIGTGNERVF
jgi:hypothetical protein